MSEISKSEKRKGIVVSIITLSIALLCPVGIRLISHPLGEFSAYLIGTFWIVFVGSPIPIDGGGMVPPSVDSTTGIIAIPMVFLRLLFVFLMFRVYTKHSSRTYAISGGILSELYLVIIELPRYFTSGIYIPIPILLLVGALFLWKFPPIVPTTPWESSGDVEKSSTSSITG